MPSVRIDDLEMYFDDYGDPSNPTLVSCTAPARTQTIRSVDGRT